ncbi:hypothetical protein GW17_00050086, partial [Ensete ventricosum]
LELGRMGRTYGSGAGGQLVEWCSSGQAKVPQLGLAIGSCKKVRGLYSESNEVFVPESIIFFIAYHTIAPHHTVRGLCVVVVAPKRSRSRGIEGEEGSESKQHYLSAGTLDPVFAQKKKHAVMLDRLATLQQSRLQQSAARSATAVAASPAF